MNHAIPATQKPCVMLLDGNPATAAASRTALEQAGFEVVVVASATAALTSQRLDAAASIVIDLAVPAGAGTAPVGCELLKVLCRGVSAPGVVAVAGQASLSSAVEAVRAGAFDYLVRPFSPSRLVAAVKAALADRRPRSAAPQPRPDVTSVGDSHRFIGCSDTMRAVFAKLAAAARSQASVFITGESGTGKELAADAVHKGSARAHRAFVAINCGAIPRDLLESTIFGHAKGAFTGATESVEGAAERADGGTLFLDELGEMDPVLQVKLLRFIQTGSYHRVGDPRPRQADIRFVAATNKDPAAAMASGCLREDLFYRLCVVRINMPPLRDRGDDVVLIARKFLENYSRLEQRDFTSIAPDVETTFLRDAWAGNVRELQNIIHQAVVLHDGPVLTMDMLSRERFPGQVGREPTSMHINGIGMMRFRALANGAPQESPHIERLCEAEQTYIEWAIRCCDGNLQAASRKLGISPSTIYRKREIWSRQGTDCLYSEA